MKKKIKDLTVKEFDKICTKNLNFDNDCKTCPLKKFRSCISIKAYLVIKEKDYINKEIEVEDNE